MKLSRGDAETRRRGDAEEKRRRGEEKKRGRETVFSFLLVSVSSISACPHKPLIQCGEQGIQILAAPLPCPEDRMPLRNLPSCVPCRVRHRLNFMGFSSFQSPTVGLQPE
jgi:hypothetical protein